MKKVVLRCAYLGLRYHGFQSQPDVPTVQAELIAALRRLGYRYQLRFVSRTDARVSAVDQILLLPNNIPAVSLLNETLPNDIRIWSYAISSERLMVLSKTYLYVAPRLDVNEDVLLEASEYVSAQTHDYYHLIKKPSRLPRAETLMRLKIRLKFERDNIYFFVKGKKFHWEQVRRLITLLMSVGLRIISMNSLRSILVGKPYRGGIPPAPPEGLILWKIETNIDNVFKCIISESRIREWVLREVKDAALKAKWTFPPREF